MKYGKITKICFDNLNVIERLNKIKINVYNLYFSKETGKYEITLMQKGKAKYSNTCNLLFYKFKNNDSQISWHCFLIKSHIQQFLQNFVTIEFKDNEVICGYCFSKLANSIELKKHKKYFCCNKKDISVKVYPQNEYLYFKNFGKTNMYDYLCFYDFEAAFNVVNTSEKIHMPIIYSYIIINTKIREIVDTYSEINTDPEILIKSFF